MSINCPTSLMDNQMDKFKLRAVSRSHFYRLAKSDSRTDYFTVEEQDEVITSLEYKTEYYPDKDDKDGQ